MCGIAGSTDDRDGRLVESMSSAQRHRGPDDCGLHADPRTGVSIGVRRLAIMDIAGGHQPLSNEDQSIWVAFNGEIYNTPDLRRHLISRGHRFATSCDTEVLVHLYEEFGEAMVHALEGMFAFAIWDEKRRRLLLARDRFGEKPLFVHETGGDVLFASELTALFQAKPSLRDLSPASVDAYFVFGYVPGPETIVPGVRQLPPGSLLSWEFDRRRSTERRWWSPPEAPATRLSEPFSALAAEAERLFRDAVRMRMVADVPVGVFLSGGIDSTLVASAATRESSRQVKTFTIGYDTGSFDETKQARTVAKALGTEHHEVILTQSEIAERTPALLASMDQPLADQALISLHALSDFARPLVTVALGGEGADEIFGGYPRYRWIERARRVEASLPRASRGLAGLLRATRIDGAERLVQRAGPGPVLERHLDWVTGGRRHQRAELYGPRLKGIDGNAVLSNLESRAGAVDVGSAGRSLMRLDQIDYLPDSVLTKTDRAGMLVSLEIRTVYLQRRLAEFAASVDTGLHLGAGGKTLLHAMLPPDMHRPQRRGRFRKVAFRAPVAEWLRGPLSPVLQDQLANGAIYKDGWFDRERVGTFVAQHLANDRDNSDLLWPLFTFGIWADRLFGIDVG